MMERGTGSANERGFDKKPDALEDFQEKPAMKTEKVMFSLVAWFTAAVAVPAAERNDSPTAGVSPAEHLPPHIRRLTWFGERADWSHDGKRILFVEKTFGDVYEVELETGIIRPMTHHYRHYGYTRALY